MKQNKKGLSYIVIPVTIMVLMFGIFLFIFLKEMTDQYYIGELSQVSHNIAGNTSLGSTFNETLGKLDTAYDEAFWDYDLYAILFVLIAFISSSYSAIQASKQGLFSFFGYLFIISMFFLLVIFFISQFTDWFFDQIFYPVFNDTILNIPFIEWVFSNIPIISISWFVWLGLLNFIDFREVADRITGAGGFER